MGVKLGCSQWGRNVRLTVFENRAMRRIFGSKRDKVKRE
jgi:hypothetical protein